MTLTARSLVEPEKSAVLPIVRARYAASTGNGFQGIDADEWTEAAMDGDLMLIEQDDVPVAALLFVDFDSVRCLVHALRWEELPRSDWVGIVRQCCGSLFSRSAILRIDAMIPEQNKAAIRLAEEVGFRYVGFVPNAARVGDDVLHAEWFVATEEDLA